MELVVKKFEELTPYELYDILKEQGYSILV